MGILITARYGYKERERREVTKEKKLGKLKVGQTSHLDLIR